MAVENTTSIAGLDASKPGGNDPKAEGDDHLRLLKNVLQHVFAGFGGEVLVAATEAQGATTNDFVLSVSPAPAAYAASCIAIFSASHANTGPATIKVGSLGTVSLLNPEGTPLRANAITPGCWVAAAFDGSNFRMLAGGNSQAIYDYVDQAQFQSTLPSQASNGGKFLSTDGSNASWQAALPVYQAAPTTNIGPIYVAGTGVMEWAGTAYAQKYSKATIGLGNVDNTSDVNKPVSSATQTALNAKANLAGATFSGTISAPTVMATGAVYSGNYNAFLNSDGNVYGPVWGGWLSNWVGGQVSTLSTSISQVAAAVNTKQPAGSYVTFGGAAAIAINQSGSTFAVSSNTTPPQNIWTTANLNPAIYVTRGGVTPSTATVDLSWNSGDMNHLYITVVDGPRRLLFTLNGVLQ